MKKVYVTKYALSDGIQEYEDWVVCGDISNDMIQVKSGGSILRFHGEGRDWHRTREGAVKRAEEMRLAKIASLRKQAERLEKKRFR